MILTRQIGRFTLRQDPVLVAQMVAYKREREGEFWADRRDREPRK
ncbi:hypothetical protein [Sphingobium sp. SYK-6]|nr:hypothetical protein [Sphingobium sp. SYK-6]